MHIMVIYMDRYLLSLEDAKVLVSEKRHLECLFHKITVLWKLIVTMHIKRT